jgi:hypothetical protein
MRYHLRGRAALFRLASWLQHQSLQHNPFHHGGRFVRAMPSNWYQAGAPDLDH